MKLIRWSCLFLALAACTQQTVTVTQSHACVGLSSDGLTIGSTNVMPVEVGCNYFNEPCVAVEICVPGTNTCQTIDHILLDTGSYGLRLFSCTVNLTLPAQSAGGSSDLAECVSYADNTSDWGPVKLADVYLAGETASNIPIQIIDPNYGNIPGDCTKAQYSPTASGFNGILGVGVLPTDCPDCQFDASDGYFACTNGTCSPTTAATSNQVVNPITALTISNVARDTNGSILALGNVGSRLGAPRVTGTLTLGIDTTGNNSSSGKTAYFADQGAHFNSKYQNPGNSAENFTSSLSFIDSGSNFWDFPDASIPECGDGLYCPGSDLSLNVAAASTGTVNWSSFQNFTVVDADSVVYDGNMCFNNIGSPFSGGFDWGLPFFYGRPVFVGISGTASSNLNTPGSDPYWAW